MRPCEQSFAVGFPIHELPLICVAIDEPFVPATMSLVLDPLALIYAAIIVDNHALSIPLPIPELALVCRVLVLLDAEILTRLDYLIIELVTFHVIVQQVLLLVRQELLLLLFSTLGCWLIVFPRRLLALGACSDLMLIRPTIEVGKFISDNTCLGPAGC